MAKTTPWIGLNKRKLLLTLWRREVHDPGVGRLGCVSLHLHSFSPMCTSLENHCVSKVPLSIQSLVRLD